MNASFFPENTNISSPVNLWKIFLVILKRATCNFENTNEGFYWKTKRNVVSVHNS